MPISTLHHCFLSKYINDQAALVSYHDPDAGLSDEERSPVPMDLESDAEAEGEGVGNGEDAERHYRMRIDVNPLAEEVDTLTDFLAIKIKGLKQDAREAFGW